MSGLTTRTLRSPLASVRGLMVAVVCTGCVLSPSDTSWISPASVMPWKTRSGVLSAVSWLKFPPPGAPLTANPITSYTP